MDTQAMTLEELARTRAEYKRQVDEATNPVARELARETYVRLHRELFARWADQMATVPPSVIGRLAHAGQCCADAVLTLTRLGGDAETALSLSLVRDARDTLRRLLEEHGSHLVTPTDREDEEAVR